MAQHTVSKKYARLRERLQKVEEKILAVCGGKEMPRFILRDSLRERKRVERLIMQRQKLLDAMFTATPEEVERMEQVSNRLFDLTQKMYARTRELYQKTIESTYDPEFDNDVDIESYLCFELNDDESILPLGNEDYYGSNFRQMFFIIGILYDHPFVERFYLCTSPSEGIPDMSDCKDELNDGKSWYHSSMPAADKLSHLCVCHAIYALNNWHGYSIPDILRMNDFRLEVTVKHQHFANQFGRANI